MMGQFPTINLDFNQKNPGLCWIPGTVLHFPRIAIQKYYTVKHPL